MPTEKTIRIPVYTYGKYRAQDGTYEEFTDEKMRALVKNTNFVIQQKAFIPAFGYVGYDHPVFGKVTDTDAHGHIKGAHYEDGVVSLDVLPIQDREGRARLIEDAKAGRRPHVSGEHHNAFSFVDAHGKTVNVGPTILGLAALGSERPALKNPKIVPLSEIEFPDSVTAADAFMAREGLRKAGMVAQTFSEGVLAFSEVTLPKIEDETPKEQPMTAEELAQIKSMIGDLKSEMKTEIAAVKTETATTIKAMSEGAEQRRKITEKVAVIVSEKKLSKIPAAKLEEAALNPTTENVLAFGETLSATVLPGGSPRKVKEGEGTKDETDEPEALTAVRPKHFSDPLAHGDILDAGLLAFGEFKPDAFKGIESNPQAQLDKLRTYVTSRDVAN
jgi:hypothetical protein